MSRQTTETINGYKVVKTYRDVPEGKECIEEWWYPQEQVKRLRKKVEIYTWEPDLEYWLNLDNEDAKKSPEQLYRRIPWLNDQKHGVQERYTANGKKLESIPWVHGLQDGTEEVWTESKEGLDQKLIYWKESTIPWSKGKRNGTQHSYWYNGTESIRMDWKDDVQDGPADYWFLNGRPHISSLWSAGVLKTITYYPLRDKKNEKSKPDDE